MGMIGAGIAGGIGQDMMRQREEGFQAEQAQRQREGEVFKTLLSSGNPTAVAYGMSGLMNPASRGGKGTKDAYMQIVHPSPALQQIVNYLHGSTTTSNVQENAPAAPGSDAPTLPGGTPPPVPPSSTGPAGAVQQTLPTAPPPGPGSAAQAPTAIDSTTATPPPQPSWQTTSPLPGQTAPPQVSSVTRPNTLGISPAEQYEAGTPGAVAREQAIAGVRTREYADQAVLGEMAKIWPQLEALGAAPQGTTQQQMDAYVNRRAGASGGATTGPPPVPKIDFSQIADPAVRAKARAILGIGKPNFENVSGTTGVGFEQLKAGQKAQILRDYDTAGPGTVWQHRHDYTTGEDEFTPILKPGEGDPAQFGKEIDAIGTPLPTDTPSVGVRIEALRKQAMASMNAAVMRNDLPEANRVKEVFHQDANGIRNTAASTAQNPDILALREQSLRLENTIRASTASMLPQPGDAANDADLVLKHQMSPSQMAQIFGGMGGANYRRMVANEAIKKDPDFNWEQAESDYQFAKSPGFQNTTRLMGSALADMGRLQTNANALANGNIRSINALVNVGKNQVNNIDLKKFQTDAVLVGDVIGKILSGGGTGNTTSDAKLQQGQALLSSSDNPQAIAATIGEIQVLLGNRYRTLTAGTFAAKQNPGGGPPKPPSASGFSVTDPTGKIHPFDTQAQADAFKKSAGIK
jgi:hypothetical protein